MFERFRYRQLSLLLGIFIVSLLLGFLLRPVSAQETAESDESFANVEERRLHVRIIEAHDQINKDRKALLLKEKELEKLREEIDLKLEELDRKLEELSREKAALRKLQAGSVNLEESQTGSLSRIYENMDPVKAAIAISDLDPETAAGILGGMRSRSAAKILDILNSRKASEITEILSERPQ